VEAILKRLGISGGRGLLHTRQGTILVAIIAAVAAAVLLLLFLSNYRKDNAVGGPTTVLVAQRVIPKGTVGSVVASDGLYKPTTLPAGQVEAAAITNPAVLANQVATRDIYPGEQITTADFVVGGDAIRGKLSGDARAVSVSLDSQHGMIGLVRAGDRVDVLAGFNAANASSGASKPILRVLARDVLVLSVPGTDSESGGGTATSIVVRVDDQQASNLSFSSDNGKVWFVLRPPSGATSGGPFNGAVTLESILSGTKPIAVRGSNR
jgi:Flp pilus assembly protein CpaB